MKENRQSFQKRLVKLSQTDRMLVDFAYDIAKESHRSQSRDSGERYFEHLRSVALILIDECKIIDRDLIISSLLHDVIEDSLTFAYSIDPYSKWKKVADFRLKKMFNQKIARVVIGLTKPKVDGKEIKTKEKAGEIYFNNLKKSKPDVILLKMCDRLHNLRSLPETTKEKRNRIIKETEEKYYPIFQKFLKSKPYQHERQMLLDKIKRTVRNLKR